MLNEAFYCCNMVSQVDCYSAKYYELLSVDGTINGNIHVVFIDSVTNEVIGIDCKSILIRNYFSGPRCDSFNFITYDK